MALIKLKLLAAILLIISYTHAENKMPGIMRFRPISHEEYNAILKLTKGQPIITEARLISSGLAIFKNLAGWTSGIWPNVLSTFGITQTTTAGEVELDKSDKYPLCVVSGDESSEKNGNSRDYKDEEYYDDDDDDEEVDIDDNNIMPRIDCIIVVKDTEKEEYEEETDNYYETSKPAHMLPDYEHIPYNTYTHPHPHPHSYIPYPYSYMPPYYPYASYHPSYQSFPLYGYEAHHHLNAPLPPLPPPMPQMPHHTQFQSQVQQPLTPQSIVHVIRDNGRYLNRHNLNASHNRKYNKRMKRNEKSEYHNFKNDGYERKVVSNNAEDEKSRANDTPYPHVEYRNKYSKVSINRAADYQGPVYVMKQIKNI